MAGIEELQKIKCLAAANLTQQNAVRPVPERRFQQIADGDARQTILRKPRFKANQVRVC